MRENRERTIGLWRKKDILVKIGAEMRLNMYDLMKLMHSLTGINICKV